MADVPTPSYVGAFATVASFLSWAFPLALLIVYVLCTALFTWGSRHDQP